MDGHALDLVGLRPHGLHAHIRVALGHPQGTALHVLELEQGFEELALDLGRFQLLKERTVELNGLLHHGGRYLQGRVCILYTRLSLDAARQGIFPRSIAPPARQTGTVGR